MEPQIRFDMRNKVAAIPSVFEVPVGLGEIVEGSSIDMASGKPADFTLNQDSGLKDVLDAKGIVIPPDWLRCRVGLRVDDERASCGQGPDKSERLKREKRFAK